MFDCFLGVGTHEENGDAEPRKDVQEEVPMALGEPPIEDDLPVVVVWPQEVTMVVSPNKEGDTACEVLVKRDENGVMIVNTPEKPGTPPSTSGMSVKINTKSYRL